MYVHLKQSGELLASQGGDDALWTPMGVRVSTEKIESAHKNRSKLDLEGLLVVSGAGNIIRGEQLRPQKIATGFEDVLGRLATIQNTIVLATALAERKVPVKVFIADNMAIKDSSIPTNMLEPYDVDAVFDAYNKDRIVLVAGGTGEDGRTTDNSVMEYARRHKIHDPEADLLVLKGTKFDGVYTKDPKKFADARRYTDISAHTMVEDLDRFGVVDEPSLRQIIDTGISMRVYADGQHDFSTAVKANGEGVGTLIVSQRIEPRLAA